MPLQSHPQAARARRTDPGKTPATPRRHWLMKTEPSVFAFDDLVRAPRRTAPWDGVRNYQARNFLRDDFRPGDLVLVYHSSIDEPAIVGVAEVTRGGYPDETALDRKSKYFDARAHAKGATPWTAVDVTAVARLEQPLTRAALAADERLAGMLVLRRGMRLSVQPLTPAEYAAVCELGRLQALGRAQSSSCP